MLGERLPRDMAAVLGRPIDERDRIAIAVSGGPDSMALLALAGGVWPGQVVAATVDHGLRADAAIEAQMVADFCDAFSPGDRGGIPHATLRPAVRLGATNVQASARTARYALLTQWAVGQGATLLATAHHADDQAETFLMRAARGSGLAGLAAIRPSQVLDDGVMLVRPLLNWRRVELRAFVESAAIPFFDDPSNTDDHYDRTRFRALLGGAPWLDPVMIARSAAYLAEADADFRAVESWLLEARIVAAPSGEYAIDVSGCPREIRRRLVRAGIAHVLGETRSAANVESLLDTLAAGKAATQADVMVSPRGDIWYFRAAPPRRDT